MPRVILMEDLIPIRQDRSILYLVDSIARSSVFLSQILFKLIKALIILPIWQYLIIRTEFVITQNLEKIMETSHNLLLQF